MNKLAKVLDHYDDGGLLLRKLFAERGMPSVIKTAADLSNNTRKNDTDYAVCVGTSSGRQFRYPCTDAGNTLASAVYFGEYGDSLPDDIRKEAATRLNGALASFGFTPPDELTKTAAMELGFSGEGDDMALEKLFGFAGKDDPFEIVEDAFNNCSPRGKRRIMMQVKEAGLADETFSRELMDYSRDEVGSDFEMALDTRKLCAIDPEATDELSALKEKKASVSPDDLAAELAAFDVRHGITHLYGSVIPDPYASVLGTSIEKSASVSRPVEIDGREYDNETISAFAENSADRVTGAFGDDFTEQFLSDPSGVLSSLPITHKQAIARMIDES